MRSVTGRIHKEVAMRFSRKMADRIVPGPIVSFTFDDFPRTALTVAGSMLGEKRLRGTYYVAMGLMGKTGPVGEMFDRDDLSELVAAGHELACHSFDHLSCCRLSASELKRGCERNCQLAAELLGGYRLRNFSFPFGDVSLSAKSALKSSYDSCRSVQKGINCESVDLAFLRANPVISRSPFEQLKEVIVEGVRRKAWVVLYTHDVTSNPSPYGCTPEYFQKILCFVMDSGAEVLTVAEAMSRFQVRGRAQSIRTGPQSRG